MGVFSEILNYLVQTALGLFLFAVLLRLMLQLTRADFYNPVSQFVVRVTNPNATDGGTETTYTKISKKDVDGALASLQAALDEPEVGHRQPAAALSLTQATEYGTVYVERAALIDYLAGNMDRRQNPGASRHRPWPDWLRPGVARGSSASRRRAS
mgnify:CR=1 FL=1